MEYDTAFRPYLAKRIEQIEAADIVVGIPCYNNDATIVHVIKQVSRGLAKHYKSARSVILISDGGSTDDTREVAREEEIMPWQEKIVFVYRGLAGKGTALGRSSKRQTSSAQAPARWWTRICEASPRTGFVISWSRY